MVLQGSGFRTHNHSATFLLIIILVLAFLTRVWGIDFGLPYLYHPDEPHYLQSAQILFKTHWPDPNQLIEPTSSKLVYVVNALAYVPYYFTGKLLGLFESPADIPSPVLINMGVGVIAKPSTVLLGRLISLFLGVASVFLIYKIASRQFNFMVGLLSALLLAISPWNVAHSHYITPDVYVVFFTLLVYWGAINLSPQGNIHMYLISGIALGCLVSAKINGVLISIPLLWAHFYQARKKWLQDFRFHLMVLAGLITFLITTPYFLVDARRVIKDVIDLGSHYSTGHAGMEGDSLRWYIFNLGRAEGLVALLALVEIGRGLFLRLKPQIFISIYPASYFIFISSFTVRNDRTILPILPFLCILASSFLYSFYEWLRLRSESKIASSISILLILLTISVPVFRTIEYDQYFSTINSRETARIWIEENLPPGSKIVIEPYSPFVDPGHFSVTGVLRIIQHEPKWYVENDYEYIILASGMFGRFFAEPERYSNEVALYNAFFQRFRLVKLFLDGGYEVRIYTPVE